MSLHLHRCVQWSLIGAKQFLVNEVSLVCILSKGSSCVFGAGIHKELKLLGVQEMYEYELQLNPISGDLTALWPDLANSITVNTVERPKAPLCTS